MVIDSIILAVGVILAVGAILFLLVSLGIVIFGLYELYWDIYLWIHPPGPPCHPSTIPGMKYDTEKQWWVTKEGRRYGVAYTPSKE